MTEPLLLEGLKVLDVGSWIAAPSCATMLADRGADVLKIEPPKAGDAYRQYYLLPPSPNSKTNFTWTLDNRNKRGIVIDLKAQGGVETMARLMSQCDVVIENFRPGAMDRLGLDYETLSKENPRLIYCSTHGFLKGPYEPRTALDEVAQMMGGLTYMTGPPGRPLPEHRWEVSVIRPDRASRPAAM